MRPYRNTSIDLVISKYHQNDRELRRKSSEMNFTTLHGSVYQFDSASNTSVRLKKSGGSGQGELHDEMSVVFVENKVCPIRHKVRVVVKRGDQLIPVDSVIDKNETHGVIEICRKTGNILSMQRAHLVPEIGFTPYEWSGAKRHVGNTIVSIA